MIMIKIKLEPQKTNAMKNQSTIMNCDHCIDIGQVGTKTKSSNATATPLHMSFLVSSDSFNFSYLTNM